MNRRELREQIFKLLFRAEFYDRSELPEQMELFFEQLSMGEDSDQNELPEQMEVRLDQLEEKDRAYIQTKFEAVLAHLDTIDQLVNEASKGWKTSRMGKVDLAIIRLAVYEMRFEEDIPTGVAINEAVELAKAYGTDDSSSFVNGILAKLT